MDKRTKEYKRWKLSQTVKEILADGPLSEKNIDNAIETAKELIKPLYKATLKMNDTEYKGEGETIEDAVKMINPPIYKTLAYLTLENGEKKAELRFGVFQCKRFFTNESTRKIKCEQFRKLLL